jgi:hypothetical protein
VGYRRHHDTRMAGWIDEHLNKVRTAFQDADQALDNLRKRLASEPLGQRIKDAFFEARK